MSSCSCIALMWATDVGCGGGDTTLLLAEAVGPQGRVDGVDADPGVIAYARRRKTSPGMGSVAFEVADLHDLSGVRYDVVFGRRVLMYQKDALGTVRGLCDLLLPGGVMVFQESDERGSRLEDERLVLHNRAQSWIWDTVRHEGGDTTIGGRLYEIMKAAGMRVLDYRAELVVQTLETGSDLAWVVEMMQKRMRAAGIPVETEGLQARLDEEMRRVGHPFIRDLAYGICAAK